MSEQPKTPEERLDEAVEEMLKQRRRYIWLEYYDPKGKRRVRRRAYAGKVSLIAIVEADVERDDDTAPKASGGGLSGGFESRPPGKYAPRELLDALNRDLDLWLNWFGIEGWYSTADKLRELRSTLPDLEDRQTIFECSRELTQWAGRLRRYAGLERMYRPRATCPQCDKVGTLTVWIDEGDRRADRAQCHGCGAGWDAQTVGILLEHVRGENNAPKVDLVKRVKPAIKEAV